MLTLVLGSGNAADAHRGGVISALDAADRRPSWVAGSGTGAVVTVLAPGNPSGQRASVIQRFWCHSGLSDGCASRVPGSRHKAPYLTVAMQARPTQRLSLLQSGAFRLMALGRNPSLYDAAPMRELADA